MRAVSSKAYRAQRRATLSTQAARRCPSGQGDGVERGTTSAWKVNQAKPDGCRYRFHAIAYPKFPHERAEMELDRAFGDGEVARDLLVLASPRDQTQHLKLPRGDTHLRRGGTTHLAQQLRGDDRLQQRATRID